jgi:hypothetical protein
LWTALRALDGYLTGQSDWIGNYAERHGAGLRVDIAIIEGTANFPVNRRMNESIPGDRREQNFSCRHEASAAHADVAMADRSLTQQ